VDDNKVIRQLIRVNLELEGLEVVTAADGAECLDVVHQVRPDVVTLDVVMPRLDGLRTAARLRADPRTQHLPLAIISACTQFEVETGLDVGVDAFLAKPFEPSELVQLVKHLIERKTGHEGGGGDGPGGEGRGGDGDGGGDRGGGGGGDGEVVAEIDGGEESPLHGRLPGPGASSGTSGSSGDGHTDFPGREELPARDGFPGHDGFAGRGSSSGGGPADGHGGLPGH
jgi:CheY-like chemotaxis protein